MKIMVNSNKTKATIYYKSHNVNLYHSEGLVMDLVAYMLSPIKTSTWGEYNLRLESSQEDTNIINLGAIKVA